MYRLDPTVPENLKSWLVLRIQFIQDDELSSGLKTAILQMNNGIIVCSCVLGWSLWQYVFKENLKQFGPNDMTWLLIVYLASVFLPIIYTLNAAVNTVAIVDSGCKQKLSLLVLDIEMLSKGT